jgi:hypothetical protein
MKSPSETMGIRVIFRVSSQLFAVFVLLSRFFLHIFNERIFLAFRADRQREHFVARYYTFCYALVCISLELPKYCVHNLERNHFYLLSLLYFGRTLILLQALTRSLTYQGKIFELFPAAA